MEPKSQAPWKTRLLQAVSILAVVVTAAGLVADSTSLLESEKARRVLGATLPYALTAVALIVAASAFIENRKRREAEATARSRQVRLDRVLQRLVRVIGAERSIVALPLVDHLRLDPLLDELAGNLPTTMGGHHKFSIARPNPDGSFTLLATRGMDPASVRMIEKRASWTTNRSFYATLLNDPHRPEFRLFTTGDTAYVDTRSAGNAASRPSSSSGHFIVALRDEDLYRDLPGDTLALISIGVPKGLELGPASQAALYDGIHPVVKAIETVLLAEAISAANSAGKR